MNSPRKKKGKRPAAKSSSSPAANQATRAPAANAEFRFAPQRIPLMILFLVISLGGGSLVLWLRYSVDVQEFGYNVTATFDRDPEAFTQGFHYDGEYLYESTGRVTFQDGRQLNSTIRKMVLGTGEIVEVEEMRKELDNEYFAEGLTRLDDLIYQLTWKSRIGFIYDLDLNRVGEFSIQGDGWGLTTDGEHLIMSDGTSVLRFLDPQTFEVVRVVAVRIGNRRLLRINELEYIHGKIYANVWHEDWIYIIDPDAGQVEARIDLRDLYPASKRTHPESVLNGVTFNPHNGRLLVTGKLFPEVYEIQLVDR